MDVSLRALLASPLGFLIGVSLGALGGGGSILAVPALVYVAGQDPQAATTTSLVVVGIVALFGVIPHWQAGRVRVGAGVGFGLAGVGGSVVGSRLNAAIDPDLLMLGFSAVMLAAAAAMRRRAAPQPAPPQPAPPQPAPPQPAPPLPAARDRTPVATSVGARVDPALAMRVLAAGTAVGLLTGFFGVGGGFVVVPALVLALRFEMPEAVGTSLLVIAINATVALAARAGTGHFEWDVIVPFALSGMLGVLVGSRIASRVPAARLVAWFSALLVAIAAYTAIASVLALAA